MLYLNEKNILGKGTTRTCYQHPEHPELCIKIMHPDSPLKINKLENKYYKRLERKHISLKHLPRCHGFVKTNLGDGLVFDKVISDFSVPLEELVENKLLSKEKLISMFKELEEYCLSNVISLCDSGMRNIILSEGRLYYIDGVITNKKHKSFLYTYLGFYSRRKTRKTIRHLIGLVEEAFSTPLQTQ